jgi:hypothetical protein
VTSLFAKAILPAMPKMTTFELTLEQVRRRKRRRRLARVHLVAQSLHAKKPKAGQPTHLDEPVKIATESERRCWEADFLSRQFISPSARALHREIIKRYLSALP